MSIPFGMDPQGMASWYYQADGRKLMEETYAPYNVVPRLGPAFAPQMGGWFKKKINTIGDYKGLRMRIAGLGGLVVAKAGGTAVVTPAGDIFGAFERGRDRRVRVGGAARRHEARPAEHRAVLLLSGLARARAP